ncbi:hypothetical protein GCM10020360_24830 [Nonlabens tegetincola]
MQIAVDTDDMTSLQTRLREAAHEMGDAVPSLPPSAVYGPPVLGAAVAAFEAAMRADARRLTERWRSLETGVRESAADAAKVEERITAIVEQLAGGLR